MNLEKQVDFMFLMRLRKGRDALGHKSQCIILPQNRKWTEMQLESLLRMSHYLSSLYRFWPVNCVFWPIESLNMAVPPFLWPINCLKIGGHDELLSGPAVYALHVKKHCLILKGSRIILATE